MPPKPKFTKEEIVSTALELVSERGIDALTARDLGNALGSSARPIFTVFRNMEEVQDAVREAAMHRFENFASHAFSDMPAFKQVGMQMVFFGAQEPKLFQLLFMHENEKAECFDDVFQMLGPKAELCISGICQEHGFTQAQAKRLFENVWIYTFGIGTLCATGVCHFTNEQLGQMLTTQFQAMLHLIQAERG